MKINLAENMLRFGVKNLNETATKRVKTLAEQKPVQSQPAPVTPAAAAPLKPVNGIKIDSVEVFWNSGQQKSIAKINVVPSSDNKNYMITGINLMTPDNKNPYEFKFKQALTFAKGANDKIMNVWKPLIADSLKSADANKLLMYMNLPGGATGGASGKYISDPSQIAIHLANSIYNGLSEYKLTV